MSTVAVFGAIGGTGRAVNRTLPFETMARLFARSSSQEAEDRQRQETVVRESGLAWTLVKPPRLTDAPRRGPIQAGPLVRVGMLSHISRLDLAEFLLDEIAQPRFVGQVVFVRT